MLRRFRDRYLLSHGVGRAIVDAYYLYGEKAARWLDGHPLAKARVRDVLDPLVKWTRDFLND